MPEGPEIRQTADQLVAALCDRVIDSAELEHEALRGQRRYIVGHRVTAVDCHGKALLTRFSSGRTLYSHNQLYGIWTVMPRGETPQTTRALRLALHTAEYSARLYSATDISLWRDEALTEHPFLRRLGPDVLANETVADHVLDRLERAEFRNRRLATLYLDQGFLAGIGNYLRSEILFFAGVHPQARPIDLEPAARRRLAVNTLRISKRSYRTRGVTLPARLAPPACCRAGRAYEAGRFAVFARAGQPCYWCGAKIRKAEMASRRLYWCPTCQPASP